MRNGLLLNKLASILEFWDETLQDWSLPIAGGDFVLRILFFDHQGTSLFTNWSPSLGSIR